MTLVVAQKLGNRIGMVADTATTDAVSHKPYKRFANGRDILKIIHVNPRMAIGFSGSLLKIDRALSSLRKHNLNKPEDIQSFLFESHKNNIEDTEFIIVDIDNNSIIEIKAGIVKKVNFSWIGSELGFNLFQKYREIHINDLINSNKDRTDCGSRTIIDRISNSDALVPLLSDCMYGVIHDPEMTKIRQNQGHDFVGGMVVQVFDGQKSGILEFFDYFRSYGHMEPIPGEKSLFKHTWGDAGLGDFTIGFCSSQSPKGTECAFVSPEGQFGIWFDKSYEGIPRSVIELNKTPLELEETIESKSGIEFRFPLTQVHELSKRAEAALNENDIEKSIKISTNVISRWPGSPQGWYFRGLANYRIKKYQESVNDLREACRLDPNKEFIHNNLAIALWNGGWREESISHFFCAMAIAPGNKFALDRLNEIGINIPSVFLKNRDA